LVPPSIAITIGIIESILAATQGVKHITVGYGQCGNVTQDVAAMQMLKELTEYYLFTFGHKNMHITTVFHQWMGGFPQDESQAFGLISMASSVAALSKATKMITKTPVESIGVPTKEMNAAGIKASKFVVNLLKDQSYPDSEKLRIEKEMIRKEVTCLMDKVIDLGMGDVAVGVIKAFEYGIIDVPFAPSKQTHGEVLPARDNEGCIRILEFGHLGMSEEIKKFHKEKLLERANSEQRALDFQMTVDDVYAVGMGHLIGRLK
jgi:methylaspartate mutase epsilon subunit